MAVLRHPLFEQVRTANMSGRCYREPPLIWQAPDGTRIEARLTWHRRVGPGLR